jgi:coproporphyrinogen III oxidase-like Fe-S oxidoreductase
MEQRRRPGEDGHAPLRPLVAEGLLAAHADRYEVTPVGRYFLRNIAMALDAYLPQARPGVRSRFSRTV